MDAVSRMQHLEPALLLPGHGEPVVGQADKVSEPASVIGAILVALMILAFLALDLGVFNRKSRVLGVRESIVWNVMARTWSV